jgi:hypothetical protein
VKDRVRGALAVARSLQHLILVHGDLGQGRVTGPILALQNIFQPFTAGCFRVLVLVLVFRRHRSRVRPNICVGSRGLAPLINKVDIAAPNLKLTYEFTIAFIVHYTSSCGHQLNIGLKGSVWLVVLSLAVPTFAILFVIICFLLVLDIYFGAADLGGSRLAVNRKK